MFDRKRIFIGSANFDRRSLHLNTEIGLMIDSPELARQVVARFDAIAQPANSFVLALETVGDGSPKLVWKSVKDGQTIIYDSEPGDDRWRELLVELYGTLPLEDQLVRNLEQVARASSDAERCQRMRSALFMRRRVRVGRLFGLRRQALAAIRCRAADPPATAASR